MEKTVIVHIYNFIRMSHTEPSRFIPDDFETVREQLLLVKQLGLPATWALKYDALMNEHYQTLLRENLDDRDELGAWWEITEPLCRRAGVSFRDSRDALHYDDRVDSAYAPGYEPEERKKLVDAYMADFQAVFGAYPKSIGSWILDSVTLEYAHRAYGVEAACICRDQMGVDGFTLWGGWPNGVYLPSRKNLFMPSSDWEDLGVPVFRLLGPDPIYNFEADVRAGLQGVYTLEPSWLTGRDPKFIRWYFDNLTEEPALGIGYAHVGQENNFLWENIRPGYGPQLKVVQELHRAGKLRVETMGATARWFRAQYSRTPPMSFQASTDWTGRGLAAQWYASVHYRVGLLAEAGHLRIRDLFLYREDYPCRYLNTRMKGTKSTFDALPVLFPQVWGGESDRPYIRLLDDNGEEPTGEVRFDSLDDRIARARLLAEGKTLAEFRMDEEGIAIRTDCILRFDRLPVLKAIRGREVCMEHEGFPYSFTVTRGIVEDLEICPELGEIRLKLGWKLGEFEHPEAVPLPSCPVGTARPVPPMAPEASPADAVFPQGEERAVTLTSHQSGTIRYSLNGGDWGEYDGPILLRGDTTLRAKLVTAEGQESGEAAWVYAFGRKDVQLSSPTKFDARPVFSGKGIGDLLREDRGTLDYLDGRWRGTLEDLVVEGELTPGFVESVSLGFLSHHRSGIVYPNTVELYTGADLAHLTLRETLTMPQGPGEREIVKTDALFPVGDTIGAFRIVARRHQRMPQWCIYRGTETVFTMADCLIVR